MSQARHYRSAEEWTSLAAEYQASGEDEATFCERRGLSRHTFRKHRYGKGARRDQATLRGAGFIEVTIASREVAHHVTVYRIDGTQIKVPVSVGMVAVADLVRALGDGG